MGLQPAPPSRLVQRLQRSLFDGLTPHLAGVSEWDVVDFPDYFNSGDSAIWLGQMEIARQFSIRTKSISSIASYDPSNLRADGPVVIQGGGNFGGLYLAHQHLRLKLLADFPDRAVIQMPQSVELVSPDAAKELQRAIDRHENFTLFVRDERSLQRAEETFDCAVHLVPDAVFALGGLQRKEATSSVTVQLRTDGERGNSRPDGDWKSFDWIHAEADQPRVDARRDLHRAVRYANRIPRSAGARVVRFFADRFARVNTEHALNLLSQGDLLVTDRLHGHILAELLAVPHVSVNDRYGKIRAFWETWTPDSEHGVLVDSWPEAEALVAERHRG